MTSKSITLVKAYYLDLKKNDREPFVKMLRLTRPGRSKWVEEHKVPLSVATVIKNEGVFSAEEIAAITQ